MIIIDDDLPVVKGIKKIIERSELNCEIIAYALNGEDGIEKIKEHQPDLVITDIYMPKLDGIEMIQQLRNAHYTNEFIILSGYSEFEHAQKALKLNILDYLSKPASKRTIIDTISRAIQKIKEKKEIEGSYRHFQTKIRAFDKYLTERLLDRALKSSIQIEQLSIEEKLSIEEWNQEVHLPIRLSFEELDKQKRKITDALLNFAIENVVNEIIINPHLHANVLSIDRYNSILLIHSSTLNETVLQSETKPVLYDLQKHLEQYYSICLHMQNGECASDWNATIENIRHILIKESSINPFSIQVISVKNKLSEAIRRTNIEQVEETLHSFFDEIVDTPFFASIALNVGIELFTVFKYELEDNGVEISKHVNGCMNLYDIFIHFRSWKELVEFFECMIVSLSKEALFQDNIRHSKIIEHVTKYIDEHLNERFTLNEIAQECFISRNYLGKLFKEQMGISFKEYVTQRRIEVARRELLSGKYMIYEVAELVGFDSPAYFTSVFKKELGYSPSQLLQERKI